MGQGQTDFDCHMMDIAIAMARRGLGTTWPNPSVGAVIADEKERTIIARAWTAVTGRPHAEPICLERAGDRAQGKTMYVTLEPCSHHGQTPPCCDDIINAGLMRVVVAQTDPDPRVSGRGLKKLRDAGIATERGLKADEAHAMTLGHILRVSERRPFIQLKLALDAEGSVLRGTGQQPTWVTGPPARARGHLLRAQADAILVGSKTINDDDPQLNCRLPGLEERSPVRVVLAGKTLPSASSKLIQTATQTPIWIVPGPTPEGTTDAATRRALKSQGCFFLHVTKLGDRVWLPALAETLVARGITRLLVEGGPTTWQAFSNAGLVDEVVVFMARIPNAQKSGSPPELRNALAKFIPNSHLELVGSWDLGSDAMYTFAHK